MSEELHVRQAVGLDLGSVHTRCIIAEPRGGALVYVGHAEVSSAGWAKARIVDPAAVGVKAAVALRKAGWDGTSGVTVGEGGPRVRTRQGSYLAKFANDSSVRDATIEWMRGHLRRGMARASVISFSKILDERWLIDGLEVEDPFGASGSAVEVLGSLVFSPAEHTDLVSAMKTAGAAEWSIDYELVAAGMAVGRKSLGNVLVVDIGAESSGMALWKSGRLTRVEGLYRGIAQLARDVAYDCVESVEAGHRTLHNFRGIPGQDDEMKALVKVVLNDFADYLRGELIEKDMLPVPDEVVLIGGGATLSGVREALEEGLDIRTTIGCPQGIGGLPEGDMGPGWCVACGLALMAGGYSVPSSDLEAREPEHAKVRHKV